MKIGQYELMNELGKGQFGKVFKAQNTQNGQVVALQKLDRKQIDRDQDYNRLLQEQVANLKKINHVNIVGFKAYFNDQNFYYLCMEYCDEGTLSSIIKASPKKRLPEEKALFIFSHVLAGLKQMHQNRIIHRDLKPDNIYLHNGVAKIGDLGFSQEIQSKSSMTQTPLGSPLSMAPEIIAEEDYSFQADIYSLGVTLYFMLQGQYPFVLRNVTAFDPDRMVTLIKSNKIEFDPETIISEHAKDLIKKMLQFHPQERITFPETYSHPFLLGKSVEGFLTAFKPINRNSLSNNQPMGMTYDAPQIYQNLLKESEKERREQYEISRKKALEQLEKDLEKQDMIPSSLTHQKFDSLKDKNLEPLPTFSNNYFSEAQTSGSPNRDTGQFAGEHQPSPKFQSKDDDEREETKNPVQRQKILKCPLNCQNYQELCDVYCNALNFYTQYARLVINASKLPPSNINIYVPALLSMKKLLIGFRRLSESITKGENIYQSPYFNELVQSEIGNLFLKRLNDYREIVQLTYDSIWEQFDSLKKKNFDEKVLEEIRKRENQDLLTKNTDQAFVGIMKEYHKTIKDEAKVQRYSDAQKTIFFNHQLDILDCVCLSLKHQPEDESEFLTYNSNINVSSYQPDILNLYIQQNLALIQKEKIWD